MDTMYLLIIIVASLLSIVAFRAISTRRRRQARDEYQRLLQQALDDGVLSPEETAQLDEVRREGDLTSEEVRMAALAIYRGELRNAGRDARLTAEEDSALRRLQEQLGLSEADLGGDFTQLSRLRMLARIAENNMPQVPAPVPLVPDETCHWVVQCTLADRIPVTTGERRELRGLSYEVLGIEPFAAAGERDLLRPADDILPNDVGALIITSRRTIFQGARRTVSVPHARVDHVTLYGDGLRLEEIGQSRRYFLVEDPELACAILVQSARTRRAAIRPARGRMA